MAGKVWTLTQTEDTLWYYVYAQNEDPGRTNKRKRVPTDDSIRSEKKFKTRIDVKEEMSFNTGSSSQDRKYEELLRDYFQLNVNLKELYKEWSAVDLHFNHTANIFSGQLRKV